MREAIAEGQPPLGRIGDVILAQVRDGVGQRAIEVDPARLRQRQDHRRRGDHLRHRGEVEPMRLGQRLRLRHQSGHAGEADRLVSVGGDDADRRARNAAVCDRRRAPARRRGRSPPRSCRASSSRRPWPGAGDERQEEDRGEAHHAGEEEEQVEAVIARRVEALDDRAAGARQQARQQEGEAGEEGILRARDSAGSPASRGRPRTSRRPCRCRTGRRRWRDRASFCSTGWCASQTKPKLPNAAKNAPTASARPSRHAPPSIRRARRRRCSRPARRCYRRGRSRSSE